ncbi:hypothetical protein ACJX0J_012246, partial [Zea mays]
ILDATIHYSITLKMDNKEIYIIQNPDFKYLYLASLSLSVLIAPTDFCHYILSLVVFVLRADWYIIRLCACIIHVVDLSLESLCSKTKTLPNDFVNSMENNSIICHYKIVVPHQIVFCVQYLLYTNKTLTSEMNCHGQCQHLFFFYYWGPISVIVIIIYSSEIPWDEGRDSTLSLRAVNILNFSCNLALNDSQRVVEAEVVDKEVKATHIFRI